MEDLHTTSPSDRQGEAQTYSVQTWEVGDVHEPLGGDDAHCRGGVDLHSTSSSSQPRPRRGRPAHKERRIPLRRDLQMGEPSQTVMRVTS